MFSREELKREALSYECPFCGALPGTPCGTVIATGSLIICRVRKQLFVHEEPQKVNSTE